MPTVLLVADEPWVRNQVRAALSSSEFELRELEDPPAAADLVLDWSPDVVLVDLQVGFMGGMALTRAIRDAVLLEKRAPLPVIMLLDRRADAFLARRAGAAAWVLKPFTPHELRDTIERARAAVEAASTESAIE